MKKRQIMKKKLCWEHLPKLFNKSAFDAFQLQMKMLQKFQTYEEENLLKKLGKKTSGNFYQKSDLSYKLSGKKVYNEYSEIKKQKK